MIKIILILCTLIILTTACVKETSYVEAQLSIDQITYREDDTSWFSFYIERPDLKLSEKDYEGLSANLPEALQNKYIYISSTNDKNPESGTLCDSPRFPHICNINFKDQPYLVKITYLDSSVSITEIEVPEPDKVEAPTILEPKQNPSQNSNLEMAFKDVGANTYKVSVANCTSYNNDGINPCLDEGKYEITIKDGKAIGKMLDYNLRWNYKFKSDFKINFEESVKYRVTAIKSSGKSYTEKSDTITFYKE